MNDHKNARRKLKLQVQISTDGCIARPNNEMEWLVWNWDEKLKENVNKLHGPVDTILLGRKMTSEFISYWNNLLNKPDDPEYIFAKKMMETPKLFLLRHSINQSGQILK